MFEELFQCLKTGFCLIEFYLTLFDFYLNLRKYIALSIEKNEFCSKKWQNHYKKFWELKRSNMNR